MQNKMMKTALLASVVAILSACGGDGDSKPNTQATNTTNNGSQVNKNQQSNSGSQSGTSSANTGSQTSKPTTNTGSQSGTSSANTGSQTSKPTTNTGSQSGTSSANTGSQTSKPTTNTGSQSGTSSANTGSQTSKPTTNTGSQATAPNGLTYNENSHLFANENKFLVKPPEAKWQPEIDKAIAFTNQLRREKGLQDLKVDPRLAAHAQRRAEELAGRYSHTRPNGESYNTGAVYIGENITASYATAEKSVMEQWKNSKGHYENMTNAGYTKIGLGMVAVPGTQSTFYWVQIFGNDTSTSEYVFDTSAEAKQNRLSDVTVDVGRYLPAVKWLHVDGVDIQLHHVDGKGSWHDFKGGAYNGMANGYEDTRFGVIRKDTNAYKVFYRGVNTKYEDMPQTGSANYTGKAVITDGKTLNTNLDAHFKADFGNKKLTGVLSEKGNRVVDINAHIRGSTFHSPQNAPVETQGSFFGKTANELGGVFHENATGKFGAFGAKR